MMLLLAATVALAVPTGSVDAGEGLRGRDAGRRRRGDSGEVAPTIAIGARVVVHGRLKGVLRYAGRTTFGDPAIHTWYGIELDDAVGKNDGSVDGVRYFRTGMRHGIFTLPRNVVPLPNATAPHIATKRDEAVPGKVSSASSVMRAISATARDPALTPRLGKVVSPPAPVGSQLPIQAIASATAPETMMDPRSIPFGVESAKDYLSALDSKIHGMEEQHEEASALAHAQDEILERTAVVEPGPLRSSSAAMPNRLDFVSDPTQLAKDNLKLDSQIEEMHRRLSNLKGVGQS